MFCSVVMVLSISWCFLCVFVGLSEGKLFISFPTQTCQPPRGTTCVEIRKCPYFDDLLNRSTIPRPRNVIKIIRENQCGFYGNTPYVCCNPPTPAPETTTTEITTKPQVFDNLLTNLREHPNFYLLPVDICGPILTNSRITSGSKTVLNEFPWMALIAYYTDGGLDFRCGGTVINEWYILTAAHCILNSTIVGVRLGEYDLDTTEDCDSESNYCAPPTQDFYIESIQVHPDYNPKTFVNDIALIKLATPANFSYANVQPICLPIEDEPILIGKFATVSGWGVTETGYKSSVLQKVTMPVLRLSDCQKLYQRFSPITSKQICAGGSRGKDSCGGDSGGPIKYVGPIDGFPRFIQYGIVSYGPRHCGTEGKPGIYIKCPGIWIGYWTVWKHRLIESAITYFKRRK